MNFIEQLKTFKYNYDNIKESIKEAVKKELVKTGSGGSNNIIIINDDFVLKIIPNLKNNLLKKKPNNDYLEADIYKKLFQEFIETNKTPHIVGIFRRYILEDVKIMFPESCLTLDEKLLLPWDKKNEVIGNLCNLKNGYERNLIEKKGSIIVLENCPTTISYEAEIILNKKMNINLKVATFKKFIRRIIFQLIFTLAIIQEKYPMFIHNDLFLRNILGVNEILYENNDYVQYNFNSKKYYLPANGIYIKINDFGYSLNILDKNSTVVDEINNNLNPLMEVKNNYRDVYTFLFDLYNGPGLGSQSLIAIIFRSTKNKNIQKQLVRVLRTEIKKFINYKVIDKINELNPGMLDWTWNISKSKILTNTVKKPIEYFNQNHFQYFTKLPTNGRIVKIYN